MCDRPASDLGWSVGRTQNSFLGENDMLPSTRSFAKSVTKDHYTSPNVHDLWPRNSSLVHGHDRCAGDSDLLIDRLLFERLEHLQVLNPKVVSSTQIEFHASTGRVSVAGTANLSINVRPKGEGDTSSSTASSSSGWSTSNRAPPCSGSCVLRVVCSL